MDHYSGRDVFIHLFRVVENIVSLHFIVLYRSIKSVPMQSENRRKWIMAIETHQEFDYTVSRFNVCELHFTADLIQKRGQRTDLKPGAVPSIFPSYEIEYLDEDVDCLNNYLSS